MSKDTLIRFIQSCVPAVGEKVLDIVAHFEEHPLAKNDLLLKEGQVSDAYYFLDVGFMRAYTMDIDGNEITTYFYDGPSVVFEVSSFFMRVPSTENLQALSDCKGYSISYAQLNMLFHSVPEFRDFGRMVLVRSFMAFKQRTLALINKTAEERYRELITTKPALFQHAPLKHIASYLGITDTSLSRIRKEFVKK